MTHLIEGALANDVLTTEQVKAGRALLGWSQTDLAKQAGIGASTIADFERGQRTPVPANLQAMRAAFEAAGIAFVAGGAVEAASLGALARAPAMTFEAYERQGVGRYAELAATIASILNAAIRSRPDLHAQPAQHRAKDPASLRAKLAKLEIAEGRDLGAAIKDLAGVRLVFYSNADVDRFLRSGIVRDNFDVDWARTRLHYPGADFNQPDNQFIGNNFVVRLKADRAVLSEYAGVAGLWCEVQVQTILNHAWSAMAHDTIYKRPDLAGVGQAQMERISARMSKIMRQYLLPAGFEFQKVLSDFERLAEGKNLFDTGVLDRIVDAADNNERYDLLTAFEENVLPLYDNIADIYPDIRAALLRTVAAAHKAPETPKKTSFGVFDGRSARIIADRVLKIIMRLRYVDIEASFDALCELYLGAQGDEERKALMGAFTEFAKPDLKVWRQHGPLVQVRLLDRIDALDEPHRALLRPVIAEIYENALNPEVEGITSTSSTVTISAGAVIADEALKIMRKRAIDGLIALYRAADSDAARLRFVAALGKAVRMPTRGDYGDALLALVLENSADVIDFYVSTAPLQSHELRQKLEHDLLFLHRRNRGIAAREEVFKEAVEAARVRLDAAVLKYRDAVNALPDFVAFKTLVGFQSVFAPAWEGADWGWREKEAYRSARIGEIVAAINDANEDYWFAIAVRCASVQSQDMATFPSLGEFVRGVGEAHPDIAEAWLARAEGTPLARFRPGFLNGLVKSRPKLARTLAAEDIAKGRFLPEVLKFLRHADKANTAALGKRAATAAIKHGEAEAVFMALEMALARRADLGDEAARAIFLDALDYLVRNGRTDWAFHASVFWEESKFGEVLSDDDLRLVLDALVGVHEVDWGVEGILMDLSARVPEDVIALFGRRFVREAAARKDPEMRSYEALPYKLERLGPHLAAHVDAAVNAAAAWDANEPEMARFKGGALIARLHPEWSPALEQALWRAFENGDAATREFVIGILSNYEGAAFIHPLLRDIVAALPEGDELLGDVGVALHSTGVLHGDLGAIEAYRGKMETLEPWFDDKRARVRAFAERVKREYENHVAGEQRRAEEDLAMRRLAYDEPPIPPSEAKDATQGTKQ